jgi:hypothetical protein
MASSLPPNGASSSITHHDENGHGQVMIHHDQLPAPAPDPTAAASATSNGISLMSPTTTSITISPVGSESSQTTSSSSPSTALTSLINNVPSSTTPSPLPSVHNSMMHLWSRGDPSVISVGPATRQPTTTPTNRPSSGSNSNGSNGNGYHNTSISRKSNGNQNNSTSSAASVTATSIPTAPAGSRSLAVVPPVGVTHGTKLTFSPPSSSTFTAPQKVVGPVRTPQQYAEIIEKAKRAGNENTVITNYLLLAQFL